MTQPKATGIKVLGLFLVTEAEMSTVHDWILEHKDQWQSARLASGAPREVLLKNLVVNGRAGVGYWHQDTEHRALRGPTHPTFYPERKGALNALLISVRNSDRHFPDLEIDHITQITIESACSKLGMFYAAVSRTKEMLSVIEENIVIKDDGSAAMWSKRNQVSHTKTSQIIEEPFRFHYKTYFCHDLWDTIPSVESIAKERSLVVEEHDDWAKRWSIVIFR